ncbi:hypothetical protein CK203_097512 [Vitis vinifera]|uniref:Uncharacterized protein n=1 Tax=Vitis vinifera TaxID=29760 RepID=A0A438CWJ0_VITVI|nr:hypothetical protein CK203_097512 [Vitis vinifera]
MGNGQKVRFWKDKWCEDELLSVSFPSLFALAASKEVWVANMWNSIVEGDGWASCLSRPFHDWEVENVEHFFY